MKFWQRRRWKLLLVTLVTVVSCAVGALIGFTAEPAQPPQSAAASQDLSLPAGTSNQVAPASAGKADMPSLADPSKHGVAPQGASVPGVPAPIAPGEYSYNPSGRREPFAAIIKDGRLPGEEDHSLPPLQRIALTELNLIGIIWGGFGYSAMVQTPDGKGYTVRVGTRIGPNNGTVSSITENAIVIQERFTDIYGNKQVREYVKLLHAKEGSE